MDDGPCYLTFTLTHERLRHGGSFIDRTGRSVLCRYISPGDDVDAITDMLHESYAALAAEGMLFLASHQDSKTTRFRMMNGDTIVAIDDDLLVGVITLSDAAQTSGSPFYDLADVAKFGQFAVRPSHQKRGIGSRLIEIVESLARERGLTALALDTSEHASGLVDLYSRKGYRFVEYVQWRDVNYRSMVFAKNLRLPTADCRLMTDD